jgi:hypothetical protein
LGSIDKLRGYHAFEPQLYRFPENVLNQVWEMDGTIGNIPGAESETALVTNCWMH